MKKGILGSVGEGRGFDAAYFSLGHVLFFDVVGMHVCLFCGRSVLDVVRKLYSSIKIALITVLCDFAVGFSV